MEEGFGVYMRLELVKDSERGEGGSVGIPHHGTRQHVKSQLVQEQWKLGCIPRKGARCVGDGHGASLRIPKGSSWTFRISSTHPSTRLPTSWVFTYLEGHEARDHPAPKPPLR